MLMFVDIVELKLFLMFLIVNVKVCVLLYLMVISVVIVVCMNIMLEWGCNEEVVVILFWFLLMFV